nr:MAG TPA_asm: pre-rRNA processing protein [Caudoviricetes sp.]
METAVQLAAAGYGPVQYWWEMPISELTEWIQVILKQEKMRNRR